VVNQHLASDGRWLVVAIDHPLYSWPCHGLEDRRQLLTSVTAAGADAVISTYGTIRDCREAFGEATPILKLDLSNVYLGNSYPESEFAVAWRLEDARRLGVRHVLTYVQLGSVFELEALKAAARIAADADAAEMTYVCELIPVESERFPEPQAAVAVAAAVRTGAEIGAHVVKTSFPDPVPGLAEATGFGIPVIVAGGDPLADPALLVGRVDAALHAGAAGAAIGRNVWGAADPGNLVQQLRETIHPATGIATAGEQAR
jgi:fructose-bisphosphate aldolase / 2-amino-3,7-dideoxy-D-threo-hept-6-ulosonate synthase